MKASYILLIIALAFSTNVFAKKVQINGSYTVPFGNGPQFSSSSAGPACIYAVDEVFVVSVNVREGNMLSLQLITDTGADTAEAHTDSCPQQCHGSAQGG